MTESSFFYPGFRSSRSGNPRTSPPSSAKPSRPSKVVSIPVHFVDSDEKRFPVPDVDARRAASPLPSRYERPPPPRASGPPARITAAAAAVEIQRAVRGFLVRKSVRAVRRVEDEVDALGKEVERQGDRLRRDARERIRVSELLMSQLLRLDLVRGVRDYRRRVIRRTIALQEAVDAIAATEEAKEEAAVPVDDGVNRSKGEAPEGIPEIQAPMTVEMPTSKELDLEELEISGVAPDTAIAGGEEEGDEVDPAGEGPAMAYQEVQEMREATDPDAEKSPDILPAYAESDASGESVEPDENSDTIRLPVKPAASGRMSEAAAEVGRRGGRNVVEVASEALEKMAEDNRNLKRLVTELYERNELRLRLMDGLLRRVGQLENAAEKMGGKKGRQATGGRKCCSRKYGRRPGC